MTACRSTAAMSRELVAGDYRIRSAGFQKTDKRGQACMRMEAVHRRSAGSFPIGLTRVGQLAAMAGRRIQPAKASERRVCLIRETRPSVATKMQGMRNASAMKVIV
jgi:hypothetical protein